jgi:hypothetical protein
MAVHDHRRDRHHRRRARRIALGRWLRDRFARDIHPVPDPSVPVILIAAVAASALLLANIVAGAPGRNAARTPTALLLSTE